MIKLKRSWKVFRGNNVILQLIKQGMIRKIIVFLFMTVLGTVLAMAAPKKFTLVIDAGHGGKDAGAKGKYSFEKNINLKVALAFGRYVEQNCPDVKVIYTRKTDTFVPLHQRADIANKNKADVFISIHTNAIAGKKPITGLETYTMGMRRSDEKLSAAMRENEVVLIEDNYKQHYSGFDPRSPESYIIFEMINDKNMLESVNLAKGIQKHVCRTAKRPNKGVKQDAFLVLRETSMPACLIELGYITTASEERYLNDQANQEALGRGIYQAFVEYKNSKMGQPTPQPAPQPAPAPKPETPVQKEQPKDSSKQEAPAVEREPVERGAVERESVAQTHTQQQEAPAQPKEQAAAKELPVFKVQFMASDTKLKAGAKQFKGLTNVESYKDGKMWKYTVGATSSYSEIKRLRKEVAKTFPQAFVVAFKNGERMDTQEAIREINGK